MRFVDCQTFGGAFALGAVQAGWEMAAKKERANQFGALNCVSNRHLLGDDWDIQISHTAHSDGADWDIEDDVQAVFGNPPCSGFSHLSSKEFRGLDSAINVCMWAMARFTGRQKPQVLVFESVQQAYTQGVDLMHQLWEEVEAVSGLKYSLTHVLHNNYSLGGCSIRRRYFIVLSQVPFGVERVDLKRLPVVRDIFADLNPLHETWEQQPYRSLPTWWSRQMRSDTGTVDGMVSSHAPGMKRAFDLCTGKRRVEWNQGEAVSKVARRFFEKYGELPKSWHDVSERHITSDFTKMGYTQLYRWPDNRPAYVITGGALGEAMHPWQLRGITHREAARIQGFPDSWRISPMKNSAGLGATWGKGIPVHAGRWIAGWSKNSIEGNPGSIRGDLIGERERLINATNWWMDYTHLEWPPGLKKPGWVKRRDVKSAA